jgi:hypothetical protein
MSTPNQQRSRYPRPLKATHSFTSSGEPTGTATGNNGAVSGQGSSSSCLPSPPSPGPRSDATGGFLPSASGSCGGEAANVSALSTPPASPSTTGSARRDQFGEGVSEIGWVIKGITKWEKGRKREGESYCFQMRSFIERVIDVKCSMHVCVFVRLARRRAKPDYIITSITAYEYVSCCTCVYMYKLCAVRINSIFLGALTNALMWHLIKNRAKTCLLPNPINVVINHSTHCLWACTVCV